MQSKLSFRERVLDRRLGVKHVPNAKQITDALSPCQKTIL